MTTSRPTTASDGGSTGSTLGNSMDCTCQPNMTGMSEALNNVQMPSGRAIRYVKKEEAGQVLVRPVPLARGGGGYHGGYHAGHHGGYHGQSGVSSGGSNIISTLLVGLLGAFIGALIPSLIPIVIGRSLPLEEVEEREKKEELVRILTSRIQNTLQDSAFVEGLQRSLDQVASGGLARGGGGYHGHGYHGHSGVSSGGNNII